MAVLFRQQEAELVTQKLFARLVELDRVELDASLDRIERQLGEETSRPFRVLLNSYASLLSLLEQKHLSLNRLRRIVFGARTERTPDAPPAVAHASSAAPEPG